MLFLLFSNSNSLWNFERLVFLENILYALLERQIAINFLCTLKIKNTGNKSKIKNIQNEICKLLDLLNLKSSSINPMSLDICLETFGFVSLISAGLSVAPLAMLPDAAGSPAGCFIDSVISFVFNVL